MSHSWTLSVLPGGSFQIVMLLCTELLVDTLIDSYFLLHNNMLTFRCEIQLSTLEKFCVELEKYFAERTKKRK